jgi:GDP/UDP-N,N'-diacetylbacillosamine 2-epimerase (hydrolysing)
MKHAELLIGITSSGIIEAASFKKYVVNIGDRQKGRLTNGNVFDVPFNAEAIINTSKKLLGRDYRGKNIFFKENASIKIINTLKNMI